MEIAIKNNTRIIIILKAVSFCILFTVLLIFLSFTKKLIPDYFERLSHGIMGMLAAFLATLIFLKIDRNNFSDIGLNYDQNTIAKFFIGVITGIILMGLLAINAIYFSNANLELNTKFNLLNFFLMILALIFLALMEELGFRAYPLQILKDKVGVRMSIVITSVLFALYHVVNGWSITSSFLGPAIWGLIFGLAAIYSNGIAMATGIHFAANLTTSAFSSTNDTRSIWTITFSMSQATKSGGTDWVTILPAVTLLAFSIILIEIYIRKKNYR